MLKLSSSIYKFLFATLLVFLCFNGQQFVYATNLVLDKDHLNAIVEVPKVDSSQTTAATSSVTSSSTETHSFDLEFDVGQASEYVESKKFKLAIGSACNLDIEITGKTNSDKLTFDFMSGSSSVNNLKSFTITNEKVITKSSTQSGSIYFCAFQQSNDEGGGSIVLENPTNDPDKSTIKLTISGDAINVPDFKLTSSAQIYVSPNSSGSKGDSSNGNGSGDGSMSEKEKLGKTIGFICWSLAGVSFASFAGMSIYLSMKKCKCDDDDETENKKGNKKKKRKNESKV